MARGHAPITRALVTGASAGIGEEFARQLAGRGTDLVLVARRERRLGALADELRASGRTVEVIAADLATDAGRAAVETRLQAADVPIDLLVNNAGFGAYGAVVDLDADLQQQMLEVNTVAVVRLARAVLPGLVARGAGGIINVASTAAFQPDPYGATYGASKAFVLSFSQSLHEEVRGKGVRVLALCPGITPTEFQQVAGVTTPLPDLATTSAESVVGAGLRAFTAGRAVEVPGLANRVTSLASAHGPALVSRRVSGMLHRAFVGRS